MYLALPAVEQHQGHAAPDVVSHDGVVPALVGPVRHHRDDRHVGEGRDEDVLEVVRRLRVDGVARQGLEHHERVAALVEVLLRPVALVVAELVLHGQLHGGVVLLPPAALLAEVRDHRVHVASLEVEVRRPGEDDEREGAGVLQLPLRGEGDLDKGPGEGALLAAQDERRGLRGQGEDHLPGEQEQLVLHILLVQLGDLGHLLEGLPAAALAVAEPAEGLPVGLCIYIYIYIYTYTYTYIYIYTQMYIYRYIDI